MENKPQIPMVLHSSTWACLLFMPHSREAPSSKMLQPQASGVSFISPASLTIVPMAPIHAACTVLHTLLPPVLSTSCSLYLNYSPPSISEERLLSRSQIKDNFLQEFSLTASIKQERSCGYVIPNSLVPLSLLRDF